MKKNGQYFTKGPSATAKDTPKDTRKYFRIIWIYLAIALGGIAVWIFVNTKGSAYLTSFLLAMFVIVSCIEAAFAHPQRESYSLLRRLFYRK